MRRQTEITVIDAIMGAGKTTWAIDYMNESRYGQLFEGAPGYLYITPYLEQADRIQRSCPGLKFRTPEAVKGRKLDGLNQLLEVGENIASTHALLYRMDQDTYEILQDSNYTLVIDEETEFVKQYDGLTKQDTAHLFERQMVYVDEDGRVRWNYDIHYGYPADGRFADVKALCDNGNLIRVNGKFWIWEFPIEFLQCFQKVYILTYLFEGSMLSTYLKLNRMPYQVKTLVDGEVVDYDGTREREQLKELAELVEVVQDDRMNAIGVPQGRARSPLSSTWFSNDWMRGGGKKAVQLRKNLLSHYRNNVKGGSKAAMWSSLNKDRKNLKGNGYAGGFVPCNAKATNDYIDRYNLAYCINVFPYQPIRRYFEEHKQVVDADLYAISQLAQWVWRSRIRNEKAPKEDRKVTLYLPSQRMRQLLADWLAGKWTDKELRAREWGDQVVPLRRCA